MSLHWLNKHLLSETISYIEENICSALAGWLSWLEHRPVSLIPGQGKHLGCGSDPCFGHIWEGTNQCFSLALRFLTLMFLSLLSFFTNKKAMKKKMSLGEDKRKGREENIGTKVMDLGLREHL